MAEGGQREAELKAGRSEEQTRNSVERRHGEEAVTEKVTVVILAADNGQRGAQRAIRTRRRSANKVELDVPRITACDI